VTVLALPTICLSAYHSDALAAGRRRGRSLGWREPRGFLAPINVSVWGRIDAQSRFKDGPSRTVYLAVSSIMRLMHATSTIPSATG
jgi:hypothetical protein